MNKERIGKKKDIRGRGGGKHVGKRLGQEKTDVLYKKKRGRELSTRSDKEEERPVRKEASAERRRVGGLFSHNHLTSLKSCGNRGGVISGIRSREESSYFKITRKGAHGKDIRARSLTTSGKSRGNRKKN